MTLSDRQIKVFRLLSLGFDHKEIGYRLGINHRSVAETLHRVGRKTGADTKAKKAILAAVMFDSPLLQEYRERFGK